MVYANRVVETAKGQISFRAGVPGHELASLTMDPSLRMFRPAEEQKAALIRIAAMPNGVVVTACDGNTIIGYATLHPTNTDSRWATSGLPIIELGALEVSAAWRFMRIGRNLLEVAFASDAYEDWLVVSTEYAWHWDLEATRLTVWQYRKLLLAILANVSFVVVPTDDPEVRNHPANMLTLRCGSRVSPELCAAFTALAAGPPPATR